MRNETSLPERYTSKGKRISKSRQHPEMYIVDNPDGTFHAVNTSPTVMAAMNPPDPANNGRTKSRKK